MLKPLDKVCASIERTFQANYHRQAVFEATGTTDGCVLPWPQTVSLGHASKRDLVEGIDELVRYRQEVDRLASRCGLEVLTQTRIAGGRQQVPTHLVVGDADAAARVAGPLAQEQLRRARTRARVVHERFFDLPFETQASVIRRVDAFSTIDFELSVEAGAWFREHDSAGLTARRVPLEGFHAKWLDGVGKRRVVELLAAKDDLGLVRRPPLIEFGYLDPAHLASGGRRYDSHVVGDACALAYEPSFALIVENKDSYLFFEPVEGSVCVFGSGAAGMANVCRLPWIWEVPRLFYWGDMDADGLEILDGYRSAGLAVRSILTDLSSFERYERFGTRMGTSKGRLEDHVAQPVDNLTVGERALYERLCDPCATGMLRVEQERIPLAAAREALLEALSEGD